MLNLVQTTYTGLPRACVEFEILIISSKVYIVLYDLDKPESRNLANDAEAVIQDLVSMIPGAKLATIIYRDRDGLFDFIIPDLSSSKIRFKSVSALSVEGAITYLNNRQKNKSSPNQ